MSIIPMNIISNTTVLSNFAVIGQLDLLRQLYGTIYISTEVYEEIQAGLDEGYQFYGEAACLAIAQHRGWTLLTDDWLARREAERLRIRKSGSIGCLVLAIERGLCTLEQANSWLTEMIRHNYRSPIADLTPLLKYS